MTETKRWAIAMIVSLLLAFGGNYWMTTMTQVRLDERLKVVEQKAEINASFSVYASRTDSLEDDVDKIKKKQEGMVDQINLNSVASARSAEALEALAATTSQLNVTVTRLTEVVIRLEERDKLKKEP